MVAKNYIVYIYLSHGFTSIFHLICSIPWNFGLFFIGSMEIKDIVLSSYEFVLMNIYYSNIPFRMKNLDKYYFIS